MCRLRFILIGLLLLAYAGRAEAFEITSDPQYVIVNFATINELDWAADESRWQREIKPQVLSQIREMQSTLDPSLTVSHPSPDEKRLLGWSTLMEYMNFPMDQASPASPYAVKIRRILEITDELNLLVFVPLNGFQWWDELPELYNWWDPDGSHTDPAFFARQKKPEDFKQRFIAGYNPQNKWNVEWQDFQTPMRLNYRNWGGGGFRLAPPPNLGPAAEKTQLSYRQVLTSRLKVIIAQIIPFLNKWEKEGRSSLLAGVSLGTEISLNASVLPRDEFLPYGYRAAIDQLCPRSESECVPQSFTRSQLDDARVKTVNTYLLDLTRSVTNWGIPKQRLYTHVWGEAIDGDARHVNYASAAATLYSRPGMSFYGFAQDPLALPDWSRALKSAGFPAWGAVEYSAGDSVSNWTSGLTHTFNNSTSRAAVMVVYNWQEHQHTGAVAALRSFLHQNPENTNCQLPELIPTTANATLLPFSLSWKLIGADTSATSSLVLKIKKGIRVETNDPSVITQTLLPKQTQVSLPPLPVGTYSWYVSQTGCDGKISVSEPRTFIVVPQQSEITPSWVRLILELVSRLPLP